MKNMEFEMNNVRTFSLLPVLIPVFVAGSLIVIPSLIFLFFPHLVLEEGEILGNLGTFGDYIGGTLNPWFSLAATFLFLASLIYQHRELSITRKEFKNSIRAQEESAKATEKISEGSDRQIHLSLLNGYIKSFFDSVNSLSSKTKHDGVPDEGKRVIRNLRNVALPTASSNNHIKHLNSHYDLIFQIKILLYILEFIRNSMRAHCEKVFIDEMIEQFFVYFSENFTNDWLKATKSALFVEKVDQYDKVLEKLASNFSQEQYPGNNSIKEKKEWILSFFKT